MSRPIIAALAILFFLANWNGFLWPLTVASDQSFWMVQVAIANFKSQYSASWNYIDGRLHHRGAAHAGAVPASSSGRSWIRSRRSGLKG